jgi:hypothetical protein
MRAIEAVVEQHAVRQAGEAVVVRDMTDALFGLLVLGDVGDHGKHALHPAVGAEVRQQLDLGVARLAAARGLVDALVAHLLPLQREREMRTVKPKNSA